MIQRLREACWSRIRHRHLFRVTRHLWPYPDASVYRCVLCGRMESWTGAPNVTTTNEK